MLRMLAMRRCRRVAKVLQDYLDGEVDARTARAVHDHLEECRRCGLEATTYQAIKDAIPLALADDQDVEVDAAALARLRSFTARLSDGEPGHPTRR